MRACSVRAVVNVRACKHAGVRVYRACIARKSIYGRAQGVLVGKEGVRADRRETGLESRSLATTFVRV
jgi:hypothetical protein